MKCTHLWISICNALDLGKHDVINLDGNSYRKQTQSSPFDLLWDKLFIYLFWNMNATGFAMRNLLPQSFCLSASFNSTLIIDFSSGHFNTPNWLKYLNFYFDNLLLKFDTVHRLSFKNLSKYDWSVKWHSKVVKLDWNSIFQCCKNVSYFVFIKNSVLGNIGTYSLSSIHFWKISWTHPWDCHQQVINSKAKQIKSDAFTW